MFDTFIKIKFIVGADRLTRYLFLGSLMLISAMLETLSVGMVMPFLAALADPASLLGNVYVVSLLDIAHQPKNATRLIVFSGVLIIAITMIKSFATYYVNRKQAHLLYTERASIARKLFDHYIRLPYSQHLTKNIALLIQTTVSVSTVFCTVYMSAILTIISEMLVVSTITALLFTVNATVTIAVVAFVTIIGSTYALATRVRIIRLGQHSHDLAVSVNQCLIEGLSALKEMRVFGASSQFLRRLDRLNEEYTVAAVDAHVYAQIPRLLIESSFVVIVVGAVVLYAIGDGNFKAVLPLLALFGMAFFRMLPSYNRILLAINSLRINYVGLSVLYNELHGIETEGSPGNVDDPKYEIIEEPFNLLELRNVRFRYPGAEADALQGVNLKISRFQSVGLVGRSGSGKTTLVDVILGLLEVDCGRVELNGRDVSSLKLAGLVGYIPQQIYLTDDTLERNIAFGINDEDIDSKAINEAVRASQLEEFVESLPQGLKTKVGDRGVRLSGGQRQRVGIARALYRNPEILIMDEATSALDVETELAVTDAIKQLGHHKTLIVIAHRLSTVRDCDILLLLDKGRVVEQGSYIELSKKSLWFGKMAELS